MFALPLDSTLKSTEAESSLNTKPPPFKDTSPVAVKVVAVNA